ncbi:MAG: hypothetical protein R3C12_07705 [Planctomycetaceae bacterium]
MVLRVMQIFVPEGTDDTINVLLEGREILGRWRDTDAGQIVLHLLVPAEETEPIMDRFEQQFADSKGFHVILLPVDAVLPRPKPEPEPEPEPDKADVPPEPEEIKYGKQRINREELYSQVTDGLDTSLVFVGMAILSAVVAAVGLLRNDVAVIIGAMVIAPLLGPNVAMSLATTLGDFCSVASCGDNEHHWNCSRLRLCCRSGLAVFRRCNRARHCRSDEGWTC